MLFVKITFPFPWGSCGSVVSWKCIASPVNKNTITIIWQNFIKIFLIDVLYTEINKWISRSIDDTIFTMFIEKQNNELSDLLEKKIAEGQADSNANFKINIQQIKESEVFTFNMPDKFSFINETTNSSYRKIVDSVIRSNDSYKEFEINYDLLLSF